MPYLYIVKLKHLETMSEYTAQANKLAKKHGIKLVVLEETFGKHFPEDKENRSIFKMKLTCKGKSYTFKFGQSINNAGISPSMYDVLACMTKYDPGTFENFCGDFGYDEDSRTAERTYKAVCKEYKAMSRLFSEEILEELQEIS